ncbi:hypothetical protein ACS0TY_009651 [Phlomoides rotata]
MTTNHKHINTVVLFVFLIFISYGCEEIMATRTLNGEEWMKKNLVIQSVRGPVPPSGSSPCTYIPGGSSRGRCVLAGDFSTAAVEAAAPPPAFPPAMVHFGAIFKSDDEPQK